MVGAAIPVGFDPYGIAITPDGKTVYVTNFITSGTVTPITVATNTPGTPITGFHVPVGIAITPDGKTAYVANNSAGTVTPSAPTVPQISPPPPPAFSYLGGHSAVMASPFNSPSPLPPPTIPPPPAFRSVQAIAEHAGAEVASQELVDDYKIDLKDLGRKASLCPSRRTQSSGSGWQHIANLGHSNSLSRSYIGQQAQ